ncbi:hypothetical protein CHS0354_007479 [Potamilus streckersoni]|uniref:Uncharacterized protein n=1 Tax=Potamilus streckersoni TaxID=2493646 RepID=A0AAE0W3D8_9BIVA|nr:hypothetical protein CHS0354_007479 [Potamilus streckersoni]
MEVPSLFKKPVVHQVCMGENDELVPNLEDHLLCDEVIEDWDELDSYETRKSFVNQHESKPAYDDSCKDSSPPPNSPVSFNVATQFSFVDDYFNPYIYDLLHIWRESCKDYDSSGESTEVLPSDSQNSDVLSQDSQYSTGYAEEDTLLPISTHMESNHAEITTDEQDKIYVNQDSSLKKDEQERHHQRQDTGTNSTFISENYDHVLARDNDIETPAGPTNRIINSAIPEEQQEGEGTEEENDSGEDNLSSVGSPEPMLEETADGIVYRLQEILIFEDERYPSPVSLYMTSSDHQVPDMEMEIDGYFSDETSGGFNHRRSRTLNSCIDQIVPGDMLEE